MKFEGTKKSSAFFANNVNIVGATCFNKQAKRKIMAWDMRKMDGKPLYDQIVDQQSSIMFPFYDPDTYTLITIGRGEGTIAQWHLINDDAYIPNIFWAKGAYGTNKPQTGGCLIPKRACGVSKHEVNRVIKLTSNQVVPVPFRVMRKNSTYQADLYP